MTFFASSCGITVPMHTPSLKLSQKKTKKKTKNTLTIVCVCIYTPLGCIVCLNIFILSYIPNPHVSTPYLYIFSIYSYEDSTVVKDLWHVMTIARTLKPQRSLQCLVCSDKENRPSFFFSSLKSCFEVHQRFQCDLIEV